MLNFARFLRVMKIVSLMTICVFYVPFGALAVVCDANQIEVNGTCINSKFSIKTTNLNANAVFKFALSAAGTFYVDWGDGSTVDVIVRNDTTPAEYSHTYTSGGVNTINFAGLATEYNTTSYSNDKDSSGAAIRFSVSNKDISSGVGGTPTLIEQISGSVGSVFPTLGNGENENQKPIFYEFCKGCTNLNSISNNLFSGVSGARNNMFRSVFDKCSSLETIPGDLFSGVSGSAQHMFRSAFYNCTKLKDLPEDLFAGIDGAARYMFKYAFFGTEGLANKYIPAGLFAGLHNQYAADLFYKAFENSGIVTSCPEGTVQYTTGYESYWDYPDATFIPGQKVSCELIRVCTGATYRENNVCVPCPTGYNYNQSAKTSVSECTIHCAAGTWTNEYEKLDYIEGTGTQYIDTDYKISSSVLSADFEISKETQATGNIGHFAGNQDTTGGHAVNFKDTKFGLWVVTGTNGGSKITTGGAFNAEVRKVIHYEFTSDNKRSLTVDGTGENKKTFSGSIISDNNYRLFSNGCVDGCTDKKLEGRIHWFKLYEDGDLVFDFIPVRRLSDNAVGMYDMVSGTFFGNAGTGDFNAGSVIGTMGGTVCENVGIGYWSAESITNYGLISQRNACEAGKTTLTDTSTKESDCYSENGSIVCATGTYLPANSQTCTSCTVGSQCPGGQWTENSVDQGIQTCASGTFSPSGSGVCYPHILHLGNDNIYLKSTKQTTPSLNLRIGNDIFYANMTTTQTRMNKDSEHYFHAQWGNNHYYVCDDTTYNQ